MGPTCGPLPLLSAFTWLCRALEEQAPGEYAPGMTQAVKTQVTTKRKSPSQNASPGQMALVLVDISNPETASTPAQPPMGLEVLGHLPPFYNQILSTLHKQCRGQQCLRVTTRCPPQVLLQDPPSHSHQCPPPRILTPASEGPPTGWCVCCGSRNTPVHCPASSLPWGK